MPARPRQSGRIVRQAARADGRLLTIVQLHRTGEQVFVVTEKTLGEGKTVIVLGTKPNLELQE